jgi:hypothetical protein
MTTRLEAPIPLMVSGREMVERVKMIPRSLLPTGFKSPLKAPLVFSNKPTDSDVKKREIKQAK